MKPWVLTAAILSTSSFGFAAGAPPSPQPLLAAAQAQIQEVSGSAARAAIEAADVVIDVREPDEYASAHLPGAVNLPRGMLEFKVAALAPSASSKIVVYCRTGQRGALAAKTLQDMGYTRVQSLAGGLAAWQAEQTPSTIQAQQQ